MARVVKLLPRADRELSALAPALQDQIIAKIELLQEFPEIGPAMFEVFQGYRVLLAARRRYRVIYRIVSDDLIEVAYVRDCARQSGLRALRSGGSKGSERGA